MIPFHPKVLRTQTELFLELFSRTLNFLAPQRCEDIIALNYDKPSRIFPCILLTRNHMIFLVQFGINKHLLIFSKTTNCTRPTGSCNFVSL